MCHEIDLYALPVPDWGLTCPVCEYALRGLPEHRCPECGTRFDPAELVRPWTQLRAPRYTGGERPVPDFGLTCPDCDAPLAGAPDEHCPGCRRGVAALLEPPAREWVPLDPRCYAGLSVGEVELILGRDYVPFYTGRERGLRDIYMGTGLTRGRVHVPRAFYFDALHALRAELGEIARRRAESVGQTRRCAGCGEESPGHFDVCWSCGAALDGPGDAGSPAR